MKASDIMALEEKLGYHFQRRELIEQALTHSSQAREVEALGVPDPSARRGDNEMLEFLGDAREFQAVANRISEFLNFGLLIMVSEYDSAPLGLELKNLVGERGSGDHD